MVDGPNGPGTLSVSDRLSELREHRRRTLSGLHTAHTHVVPRSPPQPDGSRPWEGPYRNSYAHRRFDVATRVLTVCSPPVEFGHDELVEFKISFGDSLAPGCVPQVVAVDVPQDLIVIEEDAADDRCALL